MTIDIYFVVIALVAFVAGAFLGYSRGLREGIDRHERNLSDEPALKEKW